MGLDINSLVSGTMDSIRGDAAPPESIDVDVNNLVSDTMQAIKQKPEERTSVDGLVSDTMQVLKAPSASEIQRDIKKKTLLHKPADEIVSGALEQVSAKIKPSYSPYVYKFGKPDYMPTPQELGLSYGFARKQKPMEETPTTRSARLRVESFLRSRGAEIPLEANFVQGYPGWGEIIKSTLESSGGFGIPRLGARAVSWMGDKLDAVPVDSEDYKKWDEENKRKLSSATESQKNVASIIVALPEYMALGPMNHVVSENLIRKGLPVLTSRMMGLALMGATRNMIAQVVDGIVDKEDLNLWEAAEEGVILALFEPASKVAKIAGRSAVASAMKKGLDVPAFLKRWRFKGSVKAEIEKGINKKTMLPKEKSFSKYLSAMEDANGRSFTEQEIKSIVDVLDNHGGIGLTDAVREKFASKLFSSMPKRFPSDVHGTSDIVKSAIPDLTVSRVAVSPETLKGEVPIATTQTVIPDTTVAPEAVVEPLEGVVVEPEQGIRPSTEEEIPVVDGDVVDVIPEDAADASGIETVKVEKAPPVPPSKRPKTSALQKIRDIAVASYDLEESTKGIKSIIRRSMGERNRLVDQNYARNKKNLLFWDKESRNKDAMIDYWDMIEHGDFEGIQEKYGTKYHDLAQEYRTRLDVSHDMTKEDIDSYIENYLPHVWDNPTKAQKAFSSYYKKFGRPGFGKQRTVDYIKTGIEELGLKPKFYNIEEMVQFREQSAWQWMMTKRVKNDLKDKGLKFFKNERSMNEYDPSYRRLDSPSFDVYHRGPKGENIKTGFYGAPENMAKIVNNWLSPSLWNADTKAGKAFRVAMRGKNAILPVKFALSGFHAVETTLSSIANQLATSIKKWKTPSEAAKGILQAPVQPLIDIYKGRKLTKAWYEDTKPGTWEHEAVKLLERANATPRMSKKFLMDATENFQRAVKKGELGSAALKAFPALLEMTSKPMMDYLVPYLKTGAFYQVAQVEMQRALKANPDMSELEIDKVLAQVSDNMDNRFGQVVYDNLFWDKAVRESLMGMSLSLGWNLGSVRDFMGGQLDIGKIARDIAAGKKPKITDKSLFVPAYIFTIGMAGSLLGYLLTGKRPEEPIDAFYPKTGAKNTDGSPERLQIPAMTKDYFGIKEAVRKEGAIKGLAEVAAHKASPMLSGTYQYLTNEKFPGVEISAKGASAKQRLEDTLLFMYEFLQPISVSSRGRQQSGKGRNYLPFLGFSVAPRHITRSLMQKKIFDAVSQQFGRGVKSQAEWDQMQVKRDLREKVRKGELDGAALVDALESGAIKIKDVPSLYREGTLDGDLRAFGLLYKDTQSDLMQEMTLDELKRYAAMSKKGAMVNFLKWKLTKSKSE